MVSHAKGAGKKHVIRVLEKISDFNKMAHSTEEGFQQAVAFTGNAYKLGANEEVSKPGGVAYHASKAGIRRLTRTQAVELAEFGLTVNDIAPGIILTPMNQRAAENTEVLREAEAQIPLRRAGTPADIAHMALLLSSEAGSYCTGSTFFVAGGWMLTQPPVWRFSRKGGYFDFAQHRLSLPPFPEVRGQAMQGAGTRHGPYGTIPTYRASFAYWRKLLVVWSRIFPPSQSGPDR